MVYGIYLTDLNDQPVEAVVNLRVALYGEQLGGDPLWEELLSEIMRNGVFSAARAPLPPFPPVSLPAVTLLGALQDGGEEMSPANGSPPFPCPTSRRRGESGHPPRSVALASNWSSTKAATGWVPRSLRSASADRRDRRDPKAIEDPPVPGASAVGPAGPEGPKASRQQGLGAKPVAFRSSLWAMRT